MEANDFTPSGSKNDVDYVSAAFLAEFLTQAGADSEILSPALLSDLDSFFKKFGFQHVIISKKAGKNTNSSVNEIWSKFFEILPTSRRSDEIHYYRGIEIEAENENTLFNLIRKERPHADFLTVRSADEKVIRAAANLKEVDAVLPIFNSPPKPVAGQINHIVAKIAAENRTAFGFDLSPFLFIKGYRRSTLFSNVIEMIPILRKYNVPILLFSGASSVYEARGPYELEAFGRLIGLKQEEAAQSVLLNLFDLLQERKKKSSGLQISHGVEILPPNDNE